MKTIDDEIREVLATEGEIAAVKRARERYDLELEPARNYVRGLCQTAARRPPRWRKLTPEELAAARSSFQLSGVAGWVIIAILGIALVSWMFVAMEDGAKSRAVEQGQAVQTVRDNIAAAIREHQAIIGMSPDEAKKAWGYPQHVNKSNVLGHLSEQWIYDRGYLHFQNGVLIAVEEMR
jgi:hypothetical protein